MRRICVAVFIIICAAGMLSACGSNTVTEAPAEAVVQTPSANPEITAAPTLTPTPKPTEVPATPTPSPTPEPIRELSDFDPTEFFKEVVFCGDSLMHLYRFRAGPATHPEIFGDRNASAWLTITNYCIRLAVKDVKTLYPGDAACVPKYQGERLNLWDAVKKTGKKRVMMFFGLNDIGASGVDKFVADYQTVIERIVETAPGVKIYVLSITPMRKDKQDGMLDNKKIRRSNELLQQMCEENGWTYVDVASGLSNSEGHLITVKDGWNVSDGSNVHLTAYGYRVWDEALEKFARQELQKEYYEGRK